MNITDFVKNMNKTFKKYDVKFVANYADVYDSVAVFIKCKEPHIVADYLYDNHFKGVIGTNIGILNNEIVITFFDFSEYSSNEIERLIIDSIFDANAKYKLFGGKNTMKKSLTEKELKMDVWEWGDVKGTDEELCNHIVEYAEEKGIEYMEITEDEFEYLKKDYLKKYKSMNEGIQKKDWESWKIDSIGGTVFEYYFNGHNEKENIIQSLIEDDYPTIKVDYGEILGTLNKEFKGKTLGDMQKKGYILPWGKDVDLGIQFNYEIEKLNSVSNGNSGMVELHCDFYIPSTDEIYNFGCHAFVYVDDLDVSMFLESKKSAKKSLKEGIDETLIGESKDGQFSLYLSDQRRANHGKDPHYEIILATNGYFTKYIRTDDKKAERVVSDWITLYDIDLKGVKFSELFESKKSAKKSMKESFDDDDLLVIDVIDMMILNFGYDKKTVEKYFYKIHKLNDFDTISLDEYIKIKEEIEKALGYDIFQ